MPIPSTLTPVETEEHESEERQERRKHKEHAALLRRVPVREEVAKGQEDEPDEEVCNPWMCILALEPHAVSTGRHSQFRDNPTEDNADTACTKP